MKNYTVLFDEDTEQWIVRRHGSVKKSDAFRTQKEAIVRAKDLANKTGGTVNIKSKEGKVRAQALKSNKM
jgi:hypothetical protein